MTLDDLAALSGVKAKTISGFENGRGLSENKIKMLAAALKISDDEILRGPAFEDQQVLRDGPQSQAPTAWELVSMDSLAHYLYNSVKTLPPPKNALRLPSLISIQSIVRELINREKI